MGEQQKKSGHHVTPLPVYFNTLVALLILTVVTVAAAYIDLGKLNIFVAMGLATFKAALVMMFFMGLNYDTPVNRAYILSSFVALALLLGLTAADLWTRKQGVPVAIKKAAGALSQEDFDKLLNPTPELIAKGKESYDINCAVCHGPKGMGDGVGGVALNPKPRNFQSSVAEWKKGTSTKAMYATLAYGIPGGGMASYKALSVEERLALIHYVHTLTKEIETTSKGDELFAKAVAEDGIGGSGAGPKATVPVDFAIDRMLQAR
jgi:caa(3)-type oxidase subunit IV